MIQNRKYKTIKFFPFVLLFLILGFSGCATTSIPEPDMTKFPEPEGRGVYHTVKKGETLWRIAKTYEVSLNDIIRVNNLSQPVNLEENQQILIPGAVVVKEVILDTDATKNEFVWPVKGRILRNFHDSFRGRTNQGIDIAASVGESVKAARTGRVIFADYFPGYGYMVILDHLDGLYSLYAQNAKLGVKLGDFVIKNNEIAHVASVNNKSYLHFEIRRNTVEDNPLYYLPKEE